MNTEFKAKDRLIYIRCFSRKKATCLEGHPDCESIRVLFDGAKDPRYSPAFFFIKEEEDPLPTDIRQQDGCHNCTFNIYLREHCWCGIYICMLDAPQPRPRCGSVAMGERKTEREPVSFLKYSDRYYHSREVPPWGVCGHWKKKALWANG